MSTFRNLNFLLPFTLVALLHLAHTFKLVSDIQAKTGVSVVYPIDDAYIYMAMGKSLAEFGVWGVTRFEFSNASSAHLWTLICSVAHLISSGNELYPLVLNLIFSLGSLALVAYLFARTGMKTGVAFLGLVLVSLFAPLACLSVVGMEQCLHMFTVLLFVFFLTEFLADQPRLKALPLCLYSSAVITSATRYESLFLIAIGCFLLAYKKRFLDALFLGLAGALPVVLYGFYAMGQGSYFLPNSILLKGRTGFVEHSMGGPISASDLGLIDFVGTELCDSWSMGLLVMVVWMVSSRVAGKSLEGRLGLLSRVLLFALVPVFLTGSLLSDCFSTSVNLVLSKSSHYLACAVACLLLAQGLIWFLKAEALRKSDYWLMISILTMMIHLTTARVSWMFRYEAYFLVLVLVAVVISLKDWSDRGDAILAGSSLRSALVAVVVGSLFLAPRAVQANLITVPASYGLYRQQYQMAHLIPACVKDSGVVINDIGAISFFNDNLRIVDLFALASNEVMEAKHRGEFNQAFIGQIARDKGCEMAVVYERFFKKNGGFPAEWRKLAVWKTPDSRQGDDQVEIYAIDLDKLPEIEKGLRSFPVPGDVTVDYLELEQGR